MWSRWRGREPLRCALSQSPITPIQEARLIIEAYPSRYDPLSLCNCIAADENQVGDLRQAQLRLV